MTFSASRLALAAAFLVSSVACGPVPRSAEAASVGIQPPAAPKLIVFITVDQLRGDMLDRYRADLHFGFARLMRGARFVNAFQDHAITETAPGHASTMSGRFPNSTGIISNSAGVVDRNFPRLTGLPTDTGASPMRFQGTTLTDWLIAKDPRTHALSVSMKDRAAILPIGRSKQDVYWYSLNGSFTTSTYYRDTLPTWVTAFNARHIPASYVGAEWQLSRDSTKYSEPDAVPYENKGVDNVFPHYFPDDTANTYSYIRVTPSMDSVTALFALEGVRRTGVGNGPQTDILAVSFSATDLIGHTYGPDSREAHENEIRLDQTIGWFLDSLYKLRDSSTVMIALTGDHGMSPIPELARERGEATGDQGLRVQLWDQVDAARAGLRAAGVDTMAFDYDGETVTLDRAAVARAHLKPDSILDAFIRPRRVTRSRRGARGPHRHASQGGLQPGSDRAALVAPDPARLANRPRHHADALQLLELARRHARIAVRSGRVGAGHLLRAMGQAGALHDLHACRRHGYDAGRDRRRQTVGARGRRRVERGDQSRSCVADECERSSADDTEGDAEKTKRFVTCGL